MTASPVVDLDVWRERARVVRSADTCSETGAASSGGTPSAVDSVSSAGASVLRMPAPAGPISPFGPVMAFGLVRRAAPPAGVATALPRAVHVAHPAPTGQLDAPDGPDAARREAPVGPPQLEVLPQLSTQPGVTSAPAPRLRAVLDTRGTSRGPRR